MTETTGAGGAPPPGTPGTIVSGQQAVAVAGTAVKLLGASDPATKTVIIKALKANGGNMYVGNVSDDVTSANGIELAPGEGVSMDIDNSKTQIYIDAAVGTEGVAFIYTV